MSTAIVTGASRGFGYALATALAAEGWDLVIDARGHAELEKARAALDGAGTGSVVAIAGDVTDYDHLSAMVAIAGDDLSLIVNNAGILGPSPQPRLADYPVPALEDVIRVNVLAPLRLAQMSLAALRANRGIVVNVTSDAAIEGYEGWGGYGAAKAALEQMSRVLSVEEADVTVYWFDPGDMKTRMHQEAFPAEDISDRPSPGSRAPALVRLIESRPKSGRYVAADFLSDAEAG